MNKFSMIGLSLLFGISSSAFAADRIVLVEEMYQEG